MLTVLLVLAVTAALAIAWYWGWTIGFTHGVDFVLEDKERSTTW